MSAFWNAHSDRDWDDYLAAYEERASYALTPPLCRCGETATVFGMDVALCAACDRQRTQDAMAALVAQGRQGAA